MTFNKKFLTVLIFATLHCSIFAINEKTELWNHSNYKYTPYKPYEIKIKKPALILGGILASTVAGSIFLANYSAETIPGKIFASLAWFTAAEFFQNGILLAMYDTGMIQDRNNEVYLRL